MRELANKASVAESTVYNRVFRDSDPAMRVQSKTYGALEAVLDRLEFEAGHEAMTPSHEEDIFVIRVAGAGGFEIAVEGVIRDRKEIEDTVARLMEKAMQRPRPGDNGSDS